jgi:hypothetical protein
VYYELSLNWSWDPILLNGDKSGWLCQVNFHMLIVDYQLSLHQSSDSVFENGDKRGWL